MSIATAAPRGPLSSPRGPLVGARRGETWLVDVLDLDDQPVGPLDTVTGGSLDGNVHAEIRTSGTLTVTDPAAIDWHRHRLAVRYEFTDEAGDRHAHPLGVFLPTTPKADHDEVGTTASVEIYDKLTLLSTDQVPDTWTAAKGTTVVQAVTAVLDTVGEAARVIAPEAGGGTLRDAMIWEPGTPKLRIVNDILAAGNFFSIWVDGAGLWRLDPYVEPARRGIEWSHVAGPDAIFAPAVGHEADSFEVPNQVIIVGRAERDEEGNDLPAPFAVAENNDPTDPFSIPARGRVISHREDEQDATTENVLGQIAARRLLELSAVTSTYTVPHAYIPADLNAVMELDWPARGIENARVVLQKWSWSWQAGRPPGPVRSTFLEVRA